MWRLTVQDNICYALDEGELFTLSFEKGAKHTFVVCKNVFQIREDFTDEGLDSSRMNWRGTDDGVNENLFTRISFCSARYELRIIYERVHLLHKLKVRNVVFFRLDNFE